MSIEMIEVEAFNSGTQIKVIGVGGGGGNAVEHMISSGVQGVEFVCANTDAQALRVSNAHKVIQLGSTGLGAGSKPERGREAAEAAIDDIRLALEGTNMLFVTAGMGGGTGTGAARRSSSNSPGDGLSPEKRAASAFAFAVSCARAAAESILETTGATGAEAGAETGKAAAAGVFK